eukprot:2730430-Pyramimonas_sp.AAC.3
MTAGGALERAYPTLEIPPRPHGELNLGLISQVGSLYAHTSVMAMWNSTHITRDCEVGRAS